MSKQISVAPVSSTSPWKPLDQRSEQREIKRAAVLHTAAELFLSRGYNRTKLNDVAEQLHITKPALYNYFTSKEEILLACFEAGAVLLDETLWSTDHTMMSGMEQMLRFVESWVIIMTKPFGRCMVMLDERELSDEWRLKIRDFKRDLDIKVRRIFEVGVADKSIVDMDTKLTVFAIMGALNSIGRWYQADGGATPEELAMHFRKFVTNSIAPDRDSAAVAATGAKRPRRPAASKLA